MVAFSIKTDRFEGLEQFQFTSLQGKTNQASNQRMFYEYIRTIYGWKMGEEFAQRDSLYEVLKDLGFDNVKLYRGSNRGMDSYEFVTVARMIKVVGKYYPSSEGERFIFLAPLKDDNRQHYVDSTMENVLDGNVYHWSEYSERLAILFSLLVNVIPPFMTIQSGAKITCYRDESRIDVYMKGELMPKIPFEQYKSYAQWMRNEVGAVLCVDCGRESNGQTICDCWTMKEDWDME